MPSIGETSGEFIRAAEDLDGAARNTAVAKEALSNPNRATIATSIGHIAAAGSALGSLEDGLWSAQTALGKADVGDSQAAAILERVAQGSTRTEVTGLASQATSLGDAMGNVFIVAGDLSGSAASLGGRLTAIAAELEHFMDRYQIVEQEIDQAPAQHDALASEVRAVGETM